MKNRTQQVAGNGRIQIDAAFDEGAQPDFALDNDQRASFALGEPSHGQHHFLAQLAALQLADAQERPAPQAGQRSPQFGLEHDDQRNGGVGRKAVARMVWSSSSLAHTETAYITPRTPTPSRT